MPPLEPSTTIIRENSTPPSTYAGVIDSLEVDFAYYKLNEAAGNWADSSGGGRHLTFTTRSGLLRGEVGVLDEGDGRLGIYTDSDGAPGAVKDERYVGSLADDLFRFAGTTAFSVVVWVKPDFSTGGSFSWGVVGTNKLVVADDDNQGWGIYVEPTTLRIDVRRGLSAASRNRLRAVTTLTDAMSASGLDRVMVGVVWTGSEFKLFIDGALDNSGLDSSGASLTPYSIPSNASNLLQLGSVGIGEGTGGTNAPWEGWIDSLLVADGDLSDLMPALYASGPEAGVVEGYVWTWQNGSASWQPSTILVDV